MSKILVLYHSLWGHIETMAGAIAEGARDVSGVTVDIKRVPESLPAETLAAVHAKTDQAAPEAHPDDLADYDAIIFGTPTRFGNMSGQMRNFLDRTGNLWQEGKLVGKIGSVFASTATQHGGQETTITSSHTFLANPDLPARIRKGAALNSPDVHTFYTPGAQGYTDYPLLEDQ